MAGKIGASFALSPKEIEAIIRAELEAKGKPAGGVAVTVTHDTDKSDGDDGTKVVVTLEIKL